MLARPMQLCLVLLIPLLGHSDVVMGMTATNSDDLAKRIGFLQFGMWMFVHSGHLELPLVLYIIHQHDFCCGTMDISAGE